MYYVVLVIAFMSSNYALGTKIPKHCETETEPTKPRCGDNEVFSKCKIDCPPQSCESIYRSYSVCDPDRPCIPGCDCIDGYLRDANNTCILSESCPPAPTIPTEPQCGPNEVATNCKIVCPPQTCAGLHIKIACIKDPPCESGCDCIEGYRRDENNECIPTDKCPGVPNKPCGLNETTVDCAFRCPNQYCPADDSLTVVACKPGRPCPAGCGCKDGYLRKSDDDDTCILASDCPPVECTRPNEIWDPCSSDCLVEKCGETQQSGCETSGCKPRCVCKKNHCRDKDDICVKSKHCGSGNDNGGSTTTSASSSHSESNSSSSSSSSTSSSSSSASSSSSGSSGSRNGHFCEPTCAVPNPPNCPPITKTKSTKHGACQDGFILSKKGGKCIKIEDCPTKPKKCGYNEKYVKCRTVCPPQSCNISYTEYSCSGPKTCEPGCDCIQDHLRNASNICIPNDQCSYMPIVSPKPICGLNEVHSKCKRVCPPQTCESLDMAYACDGPSLPSCEPGCNCIDGYYRDANNVCVAEKECKTEPTKPQCGDNEVFSKCKIDCPPQSCESIYSSYGVCDPDRPCIPGCDCIDGYLRDANNTCILSESCPPAPTIPTEPQCGPNEVATNCKIVCPPQTCAGLHIKIACINDPPCESGCDCIEGYRRDENNECIPTDKCPGVPNTPCGLNETTVDCAFRCPNQYCPADDSLIEVACKPGRPCPAGCGCKDGYLRKSDDDDTCILASDCSPVECTRPNEVWDPCSSDCLIEKCGETQQSGCETSGCKPRCVCKKNYCRDKDDICVKSKNCGSGNENGGSTTTSASSSHSESSTSSSSSSSTSSSSSSASSSSSGSSGSTNGHFCEPTCAVPNPPNCPLITKTKSTKHGTCQDGFILSKKGGKCIRIEDCPKGCNGDPNAIAKACPAGCPSTCEEPNASHCYNHCEPLGCECAFGYLRSKTNGKCILPQECPGGNPCSRNETFVACKSGCPTDYCPQDDSRAIVACDPVPRPMCLSGCVCQLNHKKLSTKDPRCIVSSECPPVKCTRQNEEWNPCPSDCQGESCDSANKEPVTCNTLVLNCQPRCTCMKNFFRNSDDICISAKDCECEN